MLNKIFFIILSFFLLTGCSAKNNYEVITFSSWGSITEVNIIKNIISNYEKENPNIKIRFIHIPQNYFQKLHLLFASNTAPDIIFMNNLHLPVYSNFLENLNNLFIKEDFYPASIEALSLNNELLAIPRDISNLILYINLDKVEIQNKNLTINELLTKAQEATQKDIYGIGYEEDIFWAMPYLTYFGGGILDKDCNYIFNNAKSQKGLKFYKNLRYKYSIAPTNSQVGSSTLAQMFLDKKLAIYLSGRWIYPKIREKADFKWIVVEFPKGETAQYADASGWAISKKSKHKKEAIKFIQYLSSKKNIDYFTSTGLIIPARIDSSKELNNDYNQQAFINTAKTSVKRPVSNNYKKLTDEINSKYLKQ